MNDYVSVVIATLGAECLKHTIKALNDGTVVPNEILICIPRELSRNVEDINANNVRIIPTDVRGQVSQRLAGFESASFDYVMQLDDDIIVDRYCIENLVLNIIQLKDCAVAPNLLNSQNDTSVYKPSMPSLYRLLYSLIFNGSSFITPGSVDKAGVPHGVILSQSDKLFLGVEWLAGGCIMHKKKNLVMHDYYPFLGKAYGEDLIHSHLLKLKGIKLCLLPNALCKTKLSSLSNENLLDFIRGLSLEMRAKKYLLQMQAKPISRMYLHYFSYILKNILSRIYAALK